MSVGLLVLIVLGIATLGYLDFRLGRWAPRYTYNGGATMIFAYLVGMPSPCVCFVHGEFQVNFRSRFVWRVAIGRYYRAITVSGECINGAWVLVPLDKLEQFGQPVIAKGD